MTYGGSSGVASLVPRYTTSDGTFTAATTPTLTQVNAWLADVSALVDVALTDAGFSAPATESSITSAIDPMVEGYVAELARSVNGHGSFSSGQAGERLSAFEIFERIEEKVSAWVTRKARAFEALGMTRLDDEPLDDQVGSLIPERVDSTDDDDESEW